MLFKHLLPVIKKNITEKLSACSTNEQEIHFKELKDNTIIQLKDINENNPYDSQSKDTNENNSNDSQSKNTNENISNDSQNFNISTFDEGHDKKLEANEYINETLDYRPLNIYNPAQWKNIDTKFRDLLVEKSPIRQNNSEFPKDANPRHFLLHITLELQ